MWTDRVRPSSTATTGDGAIDNDARAAEHDEDSDGIPDAMDVCPFVPDPPQADVDGDRVGDLCDTEPTLPNQDWLVFIPMTGPLPNGWTSSGMWMQADDEWRFIDGTDQTQLLLPAPPANLDIWIGLDISAVTGAGAQVANIFFSARATGSPTFTFAAGVGTMTYSASTGTPSYNGGDLLIIALSNLDGAVRFVAVAGS